MTNWISLGDAAPNVGVVQGAIRKKNHLHQHHWGKANGCEDALVLLTSFSALLNEKGRGWGARTSGHARVGVHVRVELSRGPQPV